jgi:hypothetical protein
MFIGLQLNFYLRARLSNGFFLQKLIKTGFFIRRDACVLSAFSHSALYSIPIFFSLSSRKKTDISDAKQLNILTEIAGKKTL